MATVEEDAPEQELLYIINSLVLPVGESLEDLYQTPEGSTIVVDLCVDKSVFLETLYLQYNVLYPDEFTKLQTHESLVLLWDLPRLSLLQCTTRASEMQAPRILCVVSQFSDLHPSRLEVYGALKVADVQVQCPEGTASAMLYEWKPFTVTALSADRTKEEQGSMVVFGRVENLKVRVLIDTGATHNFLHSRIAARLKVQPTTLKMPVSLAKNVQLTTDGLVVTEFHVGTFSAQVPFAVVQSLSTRCEVILGEKFFKQYGADINFSSRELTLHHEGTPHKISLKTKAKPPCGNSSLNFMQSTECSAKQLQRWVAQGASLFYAEVVQIEKDLESAMEEDLEWTGQRASPPPIHHQGLQQVLEQYSDVFPDELPAGLPPPRNVAHSIVLEEGAKPTWRPRYRLSPMEQEEVKKQVTTLLEKEWIEPSTSPYGAPILFVSKKDGGLRMCVDYRALNKLTIKNRYCLPRIDDLFDKLKGAKVFSSLDLAQGYHQIRIPEEDVPKTAFRTPLGHFQYKVLCFGLTNAPATFQKAMDDIFRHLDDFCLVYMDDILIFSRTEEEHLRHLQTVLDVLRAHKYFAKLKKCEFMKQELLYLGHLVLASGLKPDPKKLAVVKDWPVPADLKGVCSFLGFANYFKIFLRGNSTMALPLTNLKKSGVTFVSRLSMQFVLHCALLLC